MELLADVIGKISLEKLLGFWKGQPEIRLKVQFNLQRIRREIQDMTAAAVIVRKKVKVITRDVQAGGVRRAPKPHQSSRLFLDANHGLVG